MFTDFVSARLTESGIFLEEENETGVPEKNGGEVARPDAPKRGGGVHGEGATSPLLSTS